MQNIIRYLREHFKLDFKWAYYVAVFGFIGLCIAVNYTTAPAGSRSWEAWIIRSFYVPGSPWCFLIYFVFYGFPYFVIAAITAFFNKDTVFWQKKEFWVRSLFILILMSLQASMGLHRVLGNQFSYPPDRYFTMRITAPLMPYLWIGLPLLAFWWYRDRKRGVPFMYGLVRKGFDPLPYFLLLGLMFPLVFWASSQAQFLNYYPTLQLKQITKMTIIEDEKLAFFLYEIIYGLYFIWAEIIFRGFMVVGMADTMERHAVAPMAGVYAFRHFAKPPGETISSVFGGYILGVIALRTNNIVGGAILHGSIAVMMDMLAFWRLG
jgi:hypothetical protein